MTGWVVGGGGVKGDRGNECQYRVILGMGEDRGDGGKGANWLTSANQQRTGMSIRRVYK